MEDFLLELYSEILPNKEQLFAEENYLRIFKKGFDENSISYSSIKVFTTPRRIGIIASNLPEFITSSIHTIKGPKVSLGNDALKGFLQKYNIDKSFLKEENFSGQNYWVYTKGVTSKSTYQVLQGLVPKLILENKWQKGFEMKGIFWPVPLKNILCLLGNKVVEFKFVGLVSNNLTFGNVFLCLNEPIIISNPTKYQAILAEKYVILSRQERKIKIEQDANKLIDYINTNLSQERLISRFDTDFYFDLLDKVSYYLEYTLLLFGKIDKQYVDNLPAKLIQEVLEHHQNYFVLYYQNKSINACREGSISPYFLFVSNTLTADENSVVKGHENCANSRLEDALFLLNQDKKSNLELLCDKLKDIVFHQKLGSIYNKCQRLSNWHLKALYKEQRLVENFFMIRGDLLNTIVNNFSHVAKYSKCDLATTLINEFPKLKGQMLEDMTNIKQLNFYNSDFANFIKYQYSTSCLPEENSIYLLFALADNLDSLVGLYLAGERMTSSGDKYNMRKYALNILSIIKSLSYDNKLKFKINCLTDYERGNISIKTLVKITANLFTDKFTITDFVIEDVVEFVKKRHLEYLQNKHNLNIINAAINAGISVVKGYLPSCVETLLSILDGVINNNQILLKAELIDIINVAKRINNILSEDKVDEMVKSGTNQNLTQPLSFYKSQYFRYLSCNPIDANTIKDMQCFKSLWNSVLKLEEEVESSDTINYSLPNQTKSFIEYNLFCVKQIAFNTNKFLDVEHIYDENGKINSIDSYKLLIAARSALNYLLDFKHLYALL